MKKAIILLLVFISILVLAARFATQPLAAVLGIKEKAGIRILSTPEGAQVFINQQEVGKTPFESQDLLNQEYTVKVMVDQAKWEGKINLTAETLTVINRELSKELPLSTGEILTLEKGSGVTIISTPQEAEVEIDGKYYGNTPLIAKLSTGEHNFNISKGNYLKRSIRAYVPDEFNLSLNVDLSLSEADLTAFNTPVTTSTPVVAVKNTPTGFLRVRNKPSLSSAEIARVSTGEELILLEELGSWDRVRLQNGVEGYVSKTYIEKRNP